MQTDNKETIDKIILVYDWAMKPVECEAIINVANKIPGVKVTTISLYWLEMGLFFANLDAGNIKKCTKKTQLNSDEFSCLHNQFPHEVFFNHHLHFQFQCVKNELERAAIYGDIFSLLLELIKPSLIIFAHEAFTVEKILVRVAKNRMIPTASMFHGGFRPNFAYQGLCGDVDLIWVWNDYDAKWMINFGANPDRIIKIGSVRYEDQFIKYIDTMNQNFVYKRKKAKKSIGLARDKPLITLLTAEINTGFAVPCAYPRQHRDALRGLLKMAQCRPDLQFIIKAHPGYDYIELYKHMLNFKLPNLIFNPNYRLEDVLEASDICLMVNYCTTAALEAMLHHVPVIFLDNAIYPLDSFQDSLSATKIIRIKNISDIDSSINDLLTNPELNNAALMEANKILYMFLGGKEKKPTIKLSGAIESVLSRQPANAKAGIVNSNAMHCFLYSNSVEENNKRKYITANYDCLAIMYIAASLSGKFNLGKASLWKIYENFNEKNSGRKSMSWVELRWHLLQAYIEGYLSQTRYGLKGLIVLLAQYALSPKIFMETPRYFKKMLAKKMIYQIFKPITINLIKKAYLKYCQY